MTMSDPIADMLTRIRNANTAKHDTVAVSYTHLDVYKRQSFYYFPTNGWTYNRSS